MKNNPKRNRGWYLSPRSYGNDDLFKSDADHRYEQPTGGAVEFAHLALIISDLKRSAHFYENILGLTPITRPNLGFDGLWYTLSKKQELHLMLLSSPYLHCNRPIHGGRDNHLAIFTKYENFIAIQQRLKHAGIPYTNSKSGRMAIFFRDPDLNTFELTSSF